MLGGPLDRLPQAVRRVLGQGVRAPGVRGGVRSIRAVDIAKLEVRHGVRGSFR